MEEHEDQCEHRLVRCEHCQYQFTMRSMPEHLQTCRKVNIDCSNGCGEHFRREDVDEHKALCVNEMVGCPFAAGGCAATIKRGEIHQHMKDSAVEHVSALGKQVKGLKKMLKTQKRRGKTQKDTNTQQMERLERKLRRQEKKNRLIQQQLQGLESLVDKRGVRVVRTPNQKPNNPTKVCWQITDFAEKQTAAPRLYSPTFEVFCGRISHWFCISLQFQGDNKVSVSLRPQRIKEAQQELILPVTLDGSVISLHRSITDRPEDDHRSDLDRFLAEIDDNAYLSDDSARFTDGACQVFNIKGTLSGLGTRMGRRNVSVQPVLEGDGFTIVAQVDVSQSPAVQDAIRRGDYL